MPARDAGLRRAAAKNSKLFKHHREKTDPAGADRLRDLPTGVGAYGSEGGGRLGAAAAVVCVSSGAALGLEERRGVGFEGEGDHLCRCKVGQ